MAPALTYYDRRFQLLDKEWLTNWVLWRSGVIYVIHQHIAENVGLPFDRTLIKSRGMFERVIDGNRFTDSAKSQWKIWIYLWDRDSMYIYEEPLQWRLVLPIFYKIS